MSIFTLFRNNNKNNPSNGKIPPHEMATTAMSDDMTIGLEQIVVTVTLMIVSLCVLSRHRFSNQWKKYYAYYSNSGGIDVDTAANSDGNVGSSSKSSMRSATGTSKKKLGWKNKYQNKKEHTYNSGGDNNSNPVTIATKMNTKVMGTITRIRTNNRIGKSDDQNAGFENTNEFDATHMQAVSLRKCQSSPMVSTIPSSITTDNNSMNTTNKLHTTKHHTALPKNILSTTLPTASTDENSVNPNVNNSNNNNSNNNGNLLEDDEINNKEYTTLTDHERFIKAYESHLLYSDHSRLILPTTCRLLDAKTTAGMNKEKNKEKNKNTTEHDNNEHEDNDDENENDENDKSFLKIISWFIDITHKIVSFDYIGYMILFNIRFIKALICRYKRVLVAWGCNVAMIEDDEDDEDDVTVGSFGSRRSLLSRESGHGTSSGSPRHSLNRGIGGAVSSNNDTTASTVSTSCVPTTSSNGNSKGNTFSNSMNAEGGEKNPRERFYTGEIFTNSVKSKGKEESLHYQQLQQQQSQQQQQFKSLDISTESVTSSTGFAESWEYEPTKLNQSLIGPQNYSDNSSSLLLDPPRNVLLKEVEEKKDSCSFSLDDNSYHSEIDSTMSLSEEVVTSTNTNNPPSLPDMCTDLESSSLSIDHRPAASASQVTATATAKKSKNKQIPYLSPAGQSGGSRYSIIPRGASTGSKRKDQLQKFRNHTSFMTSSHNAPNPKNISQHEEKIYFSPGSKSQTAELSYFDTAPNKATIQKLERDTPLPDRQGYILGDQFLENPKDTPLLVFVNSRSGSQQGLMLKMQLRSLMNPIQVWDLADGGPEKILESFKVFTRLRLLVCGGDGTVSWIISTLNKMQVERWPPIAILPLGTGNDLARIHGWGGGYANESLLLILKQVQEAYISLLDRWTLKIERKKKKSGKQRVDEKPFTNYMSIGMDALSALQVHNLRENSPDMFFSRAINKLWYGLYGAEDALKASCSDLPQQIVLEADGLEIPIPKDCRGLIILNIDSYLGGVPLWSRGVPLYKPDKTIQKKRGRRYSDGDSIMNFDGMTNMKRTNSFDSVIGEETESDDIKLERLQVCDSPSSCQDGRLDVISIRGNFHLGQIRVGLANAQKLCQCSRLKIELKKSIAVQLDGEPWKQDKSVLRLDREKESAIMLHRSAKGGGGMETEVADLLEWAEEKKIIQRDVHAILMKEFSRRIETKTRARRDRNEGNVFSTMKKTIASRSRNHLCY